MDSLRTQALPTHPMTRPWFNLQEVDVMVCRSWTESDSFGTPFGKGYIFSDNGGFVIQSEARCMLPGCSVCTLKEGHVYRVQNFKLLPNTCKLRFHENAAVFLLLDPATTVTEVACSHDNYVRHPIELTAIENVAYNNSTFLIDVIGAVIEVGVSRPTKKGSFIVDCHIMSERGMAIRVTLWNDAATTVLHLDQNKTTMNACIFTGMDVREFRGELYLSSTQATYICKADQFPAANAAFLKVIGNTPPAQLKNGTGQSAVSDHSLTQLLYIGRATSGKSLQDSVTLNCKVQIVAIRTDHAWFNPTCPIANCQKGVIEAGGAYWCNSCELMCHYAPPSFRLHLDVTDGISVVTVALLGDVVEALLNIQASALVAELGDSTDKYAPPAALLRLCNTTHVLEIKSHTYYDYNTHECFTCSRVYPPAADMKLGFVPMPPTVLPKSTSADPDPVELIGSPKRSTSNSLAQNDGGWVTKNPSAKAEKRSNSSHSLGRE